MNPFEIETKRLFLRPFVTSDIDELHQLWIDPEVRKYLWDDLIVPREKVAAIIAESISSFQRSRSGLWAVLLQRESRLVGFGGYWFFHEPPRLQLLYGIAPSHWRQGLATEVAEALIRYGFEVLSFDRIEASTDAANRASIRVMERAGMSYEKREYTGGLDTIYYSIRRDEYSKAGALQIGGRA